MITVMRAGPVTSLQDKGRFGMLKYGVSASGPMDRVAFERAGGLLPVAGSTGIEYTQGLSLQSDEPILAAATELLMLDSGKAVELPAPAGNYGYLRFERELDVPMVLGSRSTNLAVGLGGLGGRALRSGDRLQLGPPGSPVDFIERPEQQGDIRVIWGLHAELFDRALRSQFAAACFIVSPSLDRMGVRLHDPDGVFGGERRLGLVSDATVAGDIQILGDGTPVVLMRDHQPTGGYPRIATVVSDDLDRFAQLRPGTPVRFRPVAR